jgi:hypothetical protein
VRVRLKHRPIALLLGFEAATLAVMSALHLGGVLTGRSKPFDATHAGIAEAVICAALAAGASGLLRGHARARIFALAAVSLAIVGFLVGLTFTIRGGSAIDIGYHATVLPLLLASEALVVHVRGGAAGAAGASLRAREGDRERRSRARPRFHGEAAAQAFDQLAGDVQAEP